MLRFYNTLTGRLEDFRPLEPGKVRLYTCGPTVYDYAHIGNFRTFVFQDLLRRVLQARGYEVFQVMNITDVDDRTIENALAAGVSLHDYTEKFAQIFLQDMELLSLEKPEKMVRATEHISDMVALIERLEAKGYAYRSDGSVYFSIRKFANYGRLSKIDLSGIQAGARVDVQEYDKSDPRDFALWKAAKPGEPFWETPFGKGRPGWHIECSAMAMKYLGESFDIHTGGVDLAFPHHENEIAQSEAATGKPFVRTWLHAEHLLVEGERMAKSKGNYYTLRDLIGKGYKPSAIRYLLASVPRRKQLNFTFDGLHQAAQSVERLRNFDLALRGQFSAGQSKAISERAERAIREFDAALDDDLNTAEALAAIHTFVTEANTAIQNDYFYQGDVPHAKRVLDRFNAIFEVLGAILAGKATGTATARGELSTQPTHGFIPLEVIAGSGGPARFEGLSEEDSLLVRERRQARARRDFARADQIRQELAERGIIVEDTKDGVRWKRQ